MAGENRASEPIAIVGSACRFPGGVSSPSELWDLLRQPEDVLSEIPASRFNVDKFYHPDSNRSGTMNVRHSYLLKQDHRSFDAHFFGIKPLEANAIDPQQRLLLETTYEALESAGIPMQTIKGSQTGVFVGLMTDDYSNIIGRDLQNVPTYFASGTARSIVSNRLSYVFDLRGPSVAIDTACSSSLVALHLAVQSLRSGESCCALVGGSNLLLSPEQYIAGTKLKLFSPSGRSRMWDKDANGYGRGEGVAVLVLKTLSEALRDGDPIECIVRETGVNQDGKTRGITMPSADAQTELIRETYARAGLDLSRSSDRPHYFEAHGTGTAAGDPIEAEAISAVLFGPDNQTHRGTQPLYIGSIKTVLGHSEGTAGVAGVLKASLALQHSVIPPNLLLNELSPAVKPFYSNLRILQEAQNWPPVPDGPRRASVNSFGFGGTNAHAILEQFTPAMRQRQGLCPPMSPFNFSAASDKSLRANLVAYAAFLRQNPTLNLRDLSWTLNTRRSTLSTRKSIAALAMEDLITKLDHAAQEPGFDPNSHSGTRILGIFTGQGAQWATMGAQLLQRSAVVQECFEKLQLSLDTLPAGYAPDWKLSRELLRGPETSRIGEAVISQPLCTAVQIAIVDVLWAGKVEMKAVVGHSSGEIAAAYAAGYLSADSAIRIAYLRGLLVDQCVKDGNVGRMLAVGTTHQDAQDLCELPSLKGRLTVAAYNSPTSVTFSGDAEAIQDAQEIFEDENKFARILKVDKAYHSHHMRPCVYPYVEALKDSKIRAQKPLDKCPTWISSVVGEPAADLDETSLGHSYWADNMINPVRFSQAVEYAAGAYGPFDVAIEIGPHPALKAPTTDTLLAISGQGVAYIPSLIRGKDGTEALANSLGSLWEVLGDGSVDFAAFDTATYSVQTAPPVLLRSLPSYSWDHDRQYWHETRHGRAFRTSGSMPHPLLGTMCPDGTAHEVRFRNYLSPRQLPWLAHHRIQGQSVFPAAGYLSSVIEAVTRLYPEGHGLVELVDVHIGRAIVFTDSETLVETLLSLKILQDSVEGMEALFTFYSEGMDKDSTQMVENAGGKVRLMRSSSADSLPISQCTIGDFVEVDPERFYHLANEKGYGYEGAFKGLIDTRRRFNHATGRIAVPSDDGNADSLLIHPGFLDCALQALLVAYSYPGDGRLRTLYLPTKVDLIRVDLSAWTRSETQHKLPLPFYASIEPQGHPGELVGDVDIHSEHGDRTLFQLQGLHYTSLAPASPENDPKLFLERTWGPESLDQSGTDWNQPEHAAEMGLAFVLERVAYFYIRRLKVAFPLDARSGLLWHHLRLLDYLDHCVAWVDSDTHPWARTEWNEDTEADAMAMTQKHTTSIDLKLIQTAGEGLTDALRGDTRLLDTMRSGELLHKYFREALGMKPYLEEIGRVMGQLVHRFAHMNILEIGAGTGATTAAILAAIGHCLGSYTFTDISSAFFAGIRAEFASHHSKMAFKTLDIEKPATDQGFADNSYDVVVASLVLHATRDLETALRNARKLLRPGGFLIILEVTDNTPFRLGLIFGSMPGWWLGGEDGRKLSPCISIAAWQELMAKTGFSGTRTMADHSSHVPIPLSVMVGQAVDERVELLAEPLERRLPLPKLGSLYIIGQHEASRKLAATVREHYGEVNIMPLLEDIMLTDLPVSASVICMVDLGAESIFQDFGEARLTALQAIFNRSKTVVWVTAGAQADNPHKNIFIGLQRTIALELTHVGMQTLNFEGTGDIDMRLIATKLLQLEAASIWEQRGQLADILWNVEPELAVRDGKVMLPRMRVANASNERYNSARRPLMSPVSGSARLSVGRTEIGLHVEAVSPTMNRYGEEIQLTHSVVKPVRVAASTVFLSAGLAPTGQRLFVLSHCLQSTVSVPPNWTVSAPDDIGRTLDALLALHSHLTARDILTKTATGKKMVILDPPRQLGDCLAVLAVSLGAQLLLLTTKHEHISHPWVYVHPHATKRSLRKALPPNIGVFVDITGAGQTASDIRACLPSDCQQITYPTSTGDLAGTDFVVTPDRIREVSDHLIAAWMACGTLELSSLTSPSVPQITLCDISSTSVPKDSHAILAWQVDRPHAVQVQVQPASKQVQFSTNKTYWLVGLKGSLGLCLCEWMAERGAKHLAITSRNPVVDGAWLQAMASLGCTVRLFDGDVTDRASIQGAYRRIAATMPPIAGVAQGAMVLQDTIFPELTIDRLEKVTKPKVDGSVYLDEIFDHQTLEFFLFFSSVAYLAGNAGQSAYSAANAFMASLAANRRSRGLAASIIHLGAVVGVGYVTRELTPEKQHALHQAGYLFLSEQDFLEIFAEGVLASHPDHSHAFEISTGLRLEGTGQDNAVRWTSNPMFQHLVSNPEEIGVPESVSRTSVSVRAQLSKATSNEQRFEILKDGILGKLRAVLQLDQGRSIIGLSPDQLGVDSLVALDIQSWFRKELNIDYPMLKLLSSPSVMDLISSAVQLILPDISGDATRIPPEPTENLEMSLPPMPERSNTVTTTPSPLLTPRTDTQDTSSSQETFELSISETSLKDTGSRRSESQLTFERTVPLSFAQSRFWFLASFVEDASAFNITATVRLEGHIDANRLSKAFATVGQRHEALRTAFYTDNTTKDHMQGILPTVASCFDHSAIWDEGHVQEIVRDFESHVYDLPNGKTLRLKLLSLSETMHWLVLGYHHIALDGIGFQIFFADMERAYTGTLDSSARDILQYPDYSIRQMRQYHSGEWSRELQYWRKQFVDIPQPLAPLLLSRKQHRPTTPSFRTYSVRARLEASLETQISQCCRRFQTTPFHFYTAAFAVLLFRHGGNLTESFCVGVADANRRDADIQHSLGLFLNLLPVQFHHHPELSFANALQDARMTIQDAYSHSRVPFDVLLSELSVPRSVTHTPLFQAFVNYRQNIQETTTFCGCAAQGELVSSGRNAYDVSLDIVDSSGRESLVVLAVNADMYTEEDAGVLQRSYIHLLQTFADNPAARISWSSLYPKADVDVGIALGNGPEMDSKWPATIVERIDSMIATYPEKAALSDGVENSLTYRQVANRVHWTASKLVAQGVRNGSCVGIFQMPGPGWVCSFLAVLRTGAACVPLDRTVGVGRLASVVGDCKPDLVLVDTETLAESSFAERLGVKVLDTSTVLGRSDGFEMVQSQARPQDTAIITYTSGSTGVPRGVILKHFSYRNFFELTPPRWGIAEGSVTVLQQSSYAFDISILQIFSSLCYGGTLVIPDSAKRRDPRALCDMVASQGVTFTLATPTEYLSWANHGIIQLRTSKWECAMTGGEPLNNAVLQTFRSLGKTDLRLVNCYGPTEATIGCADQVVDYKKDLNAESEMSVLPNCNVVVVDDNLKPVPAGFPGQLLIGGAGIATGYLNHPEQSARAFVTDQWPTELRKARGWTTAHLSGDRGRLTTNGHLILHGRIEGSTQIKIRGIRVDLEDIENTIIKASAPHVLQAVVSPRKDATNGAEFLVAFVVLSNANSDLELGRLLASLPSELPLPQYMRPSVVITVDQIPRTTSGKVDRAMVDSMSLPEPPPTTQEEGSLTNMELNLRHLWEEVLPRAVTDCGRIEVESDFFSAGGNSLALVNLQGLIKDRLHITVPVHRLFEFITLRQMASLLQHGAKGSQVPPPQTVDWDQESGISPDLFEAVTGERAYTSFSSTHSTTCGIIALTGATGFLGQELLRQLINDTGITKIHCIAVRKPLEQLPDLFKNAKVVLHHGDLSSHQLGLGDQASQEVFAEADAVLHVGADISFLKSYHSLRATNVTSTKQLVQRCLPRCIPLHYVSSAAVAQLSGRKLFGPESVGQYPPSEAKEGYTASKWVSEVYLENANKAFGLPVYIHRPSSITGIGAPETDLTANLLRYARKTKAIPDLGSGAGYFDFISVQTAAGIIMEEVKESMRRVAGDIRYVHESGEVEIATDDVQSILGTDKSEPFNLMPTLEWIQLAEATGMDPLLAAYLRRGGSGEVLFPRLLRKLEMSTD